jgi:ABC-type lipoprotein release transport system permease subunit
MTETRSVFTLLAQDNAVFVTKLLLVLSALIAGFIPARRAASITAAA